MTLIQDLENLVLEYADYLINEDIYDTIIGEFVEYDNNHRVEYLLGDDHGFSDDELDYDCDDVDNISQNVFIIMLAKAKIIFNLYENNYMDTIRDFISCRDELRNELSQRIYTDILDELVTILINPDEKVDIDIFASIFALCDIFDEEFHDKYIF